MNILQDNSDEPSLRSSSGNVNVVDVPFAGTGPMSPRTQTAASLGWLDHNSTSDRRRPASRTANDTGKSLQQSRESRKSRTSPFCPTCKNIDKVCVKDRNLSQWKCTICTSVWIERSPFQIPGRRPLPASHYKIDGKSTAVRKRPAQRTKELRRPGASASLTSNRCEVQKPMKIRKVSPRCLGLKTVVSRSTPSGNDVTAGNH